MYKWSRFSVNNGPNMMKFSVNTVKRYDVMFGLLYYITYTNATHMINKGDEA